MAVKIVNRMKAKRTCQKIIDQDFRPWTVNLTQVWCRKDFCCNIHQSLHAKHAFLSYIASWQELQLQEPPCEWILHTRFCWSIIQCNRNPMPFWFHPCLAEVVMWCAVAMAMARASDLLGNNSSVWGPSVSVMCLESCRVSCHQPCHERLYD